MYMYIKYQVLQIENDRLPLLTDKQVALIGGQTGCPYWSTNSLTLLGDKQLDLFEGQTA